MNCGSNSLKLLPKSPLWALSWRNKKVPPPAGMTSHHPCSRIILWQSVPCLPYRGGGAAKPCRRGLPIDIPKLPTPCPLSVLCKPHSYNTADFLRLLIDRLALGRVGSVKADCHAPGRLAMTSGGEKTLRYGLAVPPSLERWYGQIVVSFWGLAEFTLVKLAKMV